MAMNNEQKSGAGGSKDTTDYSASKAPETRREADERESTGDTRLIPGGRHGAHVDIGMSALDRDDVPSEARRPDVVHYGDSPRGSD